jgi:hypothetical protein
VFLQDLAEVWSDLGRVALLPCRAWCTKTPQGKLLPARAEVVDYPQSASIARWGSLPSRPVLLRFAAIASALLRSLSAAARTATKRGRSAMLKLFRLTILAGLMVMFGAAEDGMVFGIGSAQARIGRPLTPYPTQESPAALLAVR